MDYPKAKGCTKTMSGFKPVLMNEYNRSYILDPKVFIVWSLCNGKNTVNDITTKFNNRIGINDGEREEFKVADVIRSLQNIGLIEAPST